MFFPVVQAHDVLARLLSLGRCALGRLGQEGDRYLCIYSMVRLWVYTEPSYQAMCCSTFVKQNP